MIPFMAFQHDAFISYSHVADTKLATALESGLEKLAKPLLKLRALNVFRDQTSLSASPALFSVLAARRFDSGALEGTVEVYRWKSEDMLAEACRRMPVEAAEKQWRQVLPGDAVPSPCGAAYADR